MRQATEGRAAMTTDDQHAGNAPHDLSYAEVLAALHDSPRFADRQAAFTAAADQLMTAWQEVEPAIRAWVARAATLTEQQWRGEPETTRAFFETWRQWFAEHDATAGAEQDAQGADDGG